MTVEGLPPIMFSAPDITDAEVEGVTRVLRSGWITTGEESIGLEADLAEYLGGDVETVTVSSCTAGLEILFAYIGLRPGARVGVPTWTFASTAIVPHRLGLLPVLLDIDPTDLTTSVGAVRAALDEGLDALVVVHMAGLPVRSEIFDLAAAAGVPVIEDAAHALGTSDARGLVRGTGTIGAAYSFYATKNLTSAEGGAIATHDRDVAEFARAHRQHGLSKNAWARYRPGAPAEYDLASLGIKANLPDTLAVIARSQLRRFPAMQERRREIMTRYRSLLADRGGPELLPREQHAGSADHLCIVALPAGCERATVVGSMAADGIGTSVHFKPLHRFSLLAEASKIGPAGVTNAEAMADRVLSLPLHTSLSDADVDRVVASLCAAIGGMR